MEELISSKDLEELQKSNSEIIGEITKLAEKLDFLDIQILRKFYVKSKSFLSNTKPWCFPILYQEMKNVHHMKIGMEAFRKRLKSLVEMGLLEKIKNSNPVSYMPIDRKERFVKMVIAKFFLINGITKFL